MNGFKRALLGYRRAEVEDAISMRDARIHGLQLNTDAQRQTITELERESTTLSGMVLEREREIRVLDQRLREANECHDRSIASLDAITVRLEELEAQARGQATRIRMKALREAVEVSKKVQALTEAELAVGADSPAEADDESLQAGRVKLEIGPLGDFSQRDGADRRFGDLGRALLRGPGDSFDESRPAGRPAARARRALQSRFQGSPQRSGQPDPRCR